MSCTVHSCCMHVNKQIHIILKHSKSVQKSTMSNHVQLVGSMNKRMAYFFQKTLHFLLSSLMLCLKRIRFQCIKVGFTRSWNTTDENTSVRGIRFKMKETNLESKHHSIHEHASLKRDLSLRLIVKISIHDSKLRTNLVRANW